jgi:hypothetical protein
LVSFASFLPSSLLGLKEWKERMKDREQWRLVVEEAKAHPGL